MTYFLFNECGEGLPEKEYSSREDVEAFLRHIRKIEGEEVLEEYYVIKGEKCPVYLAEEKKPEREEFYI